MGQDPLAQLQDIQLPNYYESGWPALGFWLILLFGLIAIIATGLFVYHYRRRRHAKRLFIQQLNRISLDRADSLQTLNQLLKSAAIHYYGRESVASLYGKPWLQFLDAQLAPTDQGFIDDQQVWLSHYQAGPCRATKKQLQQAHTWLHSALPPKNSALSTIQAHTNTQEANHV